MVVDGCDVQTNEAVARLCMVNCADQRSKRHSAAETGRHAMKRPALARFMPWLIRPRGAFLSFAYESEHARRFFIKHSMATRLTALLLSFCIGFPMCWCCVGEAPREEKAGCCSTEHQDGCAAQQPGSPAESHDHRDNCPCCQHHKQPRDAAKSLVFTPKPDASAVLHLAGWQDSLPVLPRLSAHAVETSRHERGPPGRPDALFLRHRALLL